MTIGHARKSNTLNISNPLTIDGSDIKPVTKTKLLGVTVDENLSCNEQYKIVKEKIRAGLVSLKKLKNFLPKQNSVVSTMPLSKTIYAMPMKFGVTFQQLCLIPLNFCETGQDRARTTIENARLKDNCLCDWLGIGNSIQSVDHGIQNNQEIKLIEPLG